MTDKEKERKRVPQGNMSSVCMKDSQSVGPC